VTVKEGGVTLCIATADGSGNWSCAPSTALSVGDHTISATATNGVTSSAPTTRSFTAGIPADLEVTQTFSIGKLTRLTLMITVKNKGPNAQTSAIVTDTFPAAAAGKVWSWTCVGAGGGACGAASGTGNLNQVLGALPVNGKVIFTVTGTLSNWSQWSNTVTVAPGLGTTDSVTTNNASAAGRYQILLPIIYR
jgi:uncharacterized repeat protein (TIGR01451 family)